MKRFIAIITFLAVLISMSIGSQVFAQSVNLLTNGDMENSTTGWSVFGAGTLASNTSVVHGGARSILHTGRTASWNGPRQTVTSVLTNNSSYTASVWMRTQSGTPTGRVTLAVPVGR